MTELSPVFRQRFFNANGIPLAGGLLYTYIAGTTTPKATFTDFTGLAANPNPVVLDANGYADVWLSRDQVPYKFVLKDSLNNPIWTVDNVYTLAQWFAGFTSTATTGGTTTLTVASTSQQFFTGTQSQVVLLPAVATMFLGTTFRITNLSTQPITVESHSGGVIQTMAANTTLLVSSISLSDDSPAGWYAQYTTSQSANPMTAAGDMIVGGAGGLMTRFPAGIAGQQLKSQGPGLPPLWFTPPVPIALANQIFNSSSTFIIPAGTVLTTVFKFTLIGGGAGGGGAATATFAAGSGGGAGATAVKWLSGLTAGNTIVVSVGVGGSGGSSSGGNGNAGGDTQINSGTQTISTVVAHGGLAGFGSTTNTSLQGGIGGAASGGDINDSGGVGEGSFSNANIGLAGNGGASSRGGGGHGRINGGGPGNNGGAAGSGGGGGSTAAGNQAGGNGANGIVIVEWAL